MTISNTPTASTYFQSMTIKYTHVFDWLPFQIISNTPTASTNFQYMTISNTPTASTYFQSMTIKYTHVFNWLPFQIISNTPTASTDFSKFTIINFSPHLLLLCYYYVYYEIPIFMLLFILIHVVNCRERALYTEQKKKRIFNFSLLYLQGK
jgi:hypothetical protein